MERCGSGRPVPIRRGRKIPDCASVLQRESGHSLQSKEEQYQDQVDADERQDPVLEQVSVHKEIIVHIEQYYDCHRQAQQKQVVGEREVADIRAVRQIRQTKDQHPHKGIGYIGVFQVFLFYTAHFFHCIFRMKNRTINPAREKISTYCHFIPIKRLSCLCGSMISGKQILKRFMKPNMQEIRIKDSVRT